MDAYDNFLCIISLLEIIIGDFGNYLLIYLYSYNIITGKRKRPINIIVINLAFANILLLLFKGSIFAMKACNKILFLNCMACKIIIYLQRVSRSLSLCTTCLLCFFQAITITSFSPKWAEIKARAPKFIALSCAFIWPVNLLLDVVVPLYVMSSINNTNSNLTINLGYCSIDRDAMTTLKLVIWKSLYDAVFIGSMIIISIYIVLVLYRHHRQVRRIHNPKTPLGAFPETRATKVILLLMSIFVCFYAVSSIFIIIMDNFKDKKMWSIHISVLLSLGYPIISPFVLIGSDSQITSFHNTFKEMKIHFPYAYRCETKTMKKYRIMDF